MGLLSDGSPLSWEETKKWVDHVRKHGILQFIHQYKKLSKTNICDELKYGDEVEYNLIQLDHKNRKVKLLLDASTILDDLQRDEKANPETNRTAWRPEYASYMVEGTPGKPYGSLMAHFNIVEANMRKRREELLTLLRPDQTALAFTSFPRVGCKGFTEPHYEPTPGAGSSKSLFFPEEAIMQAHPRFSTLTRNIRERRGEKVVINVPVFKDKKTPSPFTEDFNALGDDGEAAAASKSDHIYLDCMGFGMGCSCLQMTFQACCITEARQLYDQLTPLCPIVMALSAASPIYRGYLADIDCRWSVIAGSVDDRTKEERGEKEISEGSKARRIYKSRYDSIDSYLSQESCRYNDIDVVIDPEIYKQLQEAGIDKLMSQHIAHLFIRDPISLFSEKINQNDEEDTDHFENIQSTNWQTMRFKPPPPNSKIGWRVEFRPTEVQLTDFENAAFTVFIVLMTRVILSFNLNFLIHISKVDENMKTAQVRDAVRQGKFYFRKDLLSGTSPQMAADCIKRCGAKCDAKKCDNDKKYNVEDEYTMMTVDEIINGKGNEFPGLVPLIDKYLDNVECDVDTRCTISQYLKLIKMRASGELMTMARWIREFVANHPSYKQNSVVNDDITYDLICKCDNISRGLEDCDELIPLYNTRSQDDLPPALTKYYNALSTNGKTNG